MTKTYSIDGMTCGGCAATVEKALSGVKGVTEVKVSLEGATASLAMTSPVPVSQLQGALKNYSYRISEPGAPLPPSQSFWSDNSIWKRAALNTTNCLVGCSIGDFGTVIYLQAYYPSVSMTVQMILATFAGLITSVLLETILLRTREKFAWKMALQTALSMSFLSMVAMEIAMNTTDFMITGGKAAFDNPVYWGALVVALVAGFLVPLPYNYYKLKKFNLACH